MNICVVYGIYNTLHLLKKKNIVISLPIIQMANNICEGCVYRKMHKLPFLKSSWRGKAPLQLVHSDICGLMQTPTLGNKKYSILFVNDFTKMMWIYFLSQKYETFFVFYNLKHL